MASRRGVQNTTQSQNRTFHYSQKPNDDGSIASSQSDVFLEASLQFLHQLLTERITQNNYPKKHTDELNDQVEEYDECLNCVKELLPNLKLQNTSELSRSNASTIHNALNPNRNVYNNSFKNTVEGYESEVEFASNLHLNFIQKKCENYPKHVPVNVHVMMNDSKNSASPTTLLIKIPNAIMHFFRNKTSRKSLDKTDSDISTNSKCVIRKGNRFTKSFTKLLKGKKTSASMVSIKGTMNSEEVLTPRMTKSNFERHLTNHHNTTSENSIHQNKINCAPRSCFSLKRIPQPQQATEPNIFQEESSIRLPMNNKLKDKIYVTIKPSTMETDVKSENCTIASKNESLINNRILDTESEKIIPLWYVKASSQTSKNVDEQNILENLDKFWSTNKNSMSSHDKNYTQIPVEIKNALNPLILEKKSKRSIIQNCCKSIQQDKNSDILSDKERQTKVLLEMLVGTLPIGKDIPKNLEHLKNTKIMKDTKSSALEVLLRHIFIDNKNYKLNQLGEKDIATEQILPKRQLSKISICSSSGSLSYSEPDVEKHLLTSENSWQMDNCNMECGSNVTFENSNLPSASNDYQKINNNHINLHKNTTSLHPLLSKQSSQEQRELVNAMIRWWRPEVNYTTWPLSKTHTSSDSVSIGRLS